MKRNRAVFLLAKPVFMICVLNGFRISLCEIPIVNYAKKVFKTYEVKIVLSVWWL